MKKDNRPKKNDSQNYVVSSGDSGEHTFNCPYRVGNKLSRKSSNNQLIELLKFFITILTNK